MLQRGFESFELMIGGRVRWRGQAPKSARSCRLTRGCLWHGSGKKSVYTKGATTGPSAWRWMAGALRPKKFLLGTDQAAAEVANRLLKKLWQEVVAEHESAVAFFRRWGAGERLNDTNLLTYKIDFEHLRPRPNLAGGKPADRRGDPAWCPGSTCGGGGRCGQFASPIRGAY